METGIPPGALQAAERGWYVFPVRAGGKEPRPGLSWPEAATSKPARVRISAWLPGENYGVACKRSGLVVLDLDMPKPGYTLPAAWQDEPGIRDGKDVLAALAERAAAQSWPATFTVATPSGGWHLYYQAIHGRPIGNRPAGPMVDVRGGGDGNGGYVVGPGSTIAGRPYEVIDGQDPMVLPGWIADLLDPPRIERVRQALPYLPSSSTAYGDAALRDELEKLLTVQRGGRNNALNEAAFSLGQLVAGGVLEREVVLVALHQAGEAIGLGDRETRGTVQSGLAAGAKQPRRAVA